MNTITNDNFYNMKIQREKEKTAVTAKELSFVKNNLEVFSEEEINEFLQATLKDMSDLEEDMSDLSLFNTHYYSVAQVYFTANDYPNAYRYAKADLGVQKAWHNEEAISRALMLLSHIAYNASNFTLAKGHIGEYLKINKVFSNADDLIFLMSIDKKLDSKTHELQMLSAIEPMYPSSYSRVIESSVAYAIAD